MTSLFIHTHLRLFFLLILKYLCIFRWLLRFIYFDSHHFLFHFKSNKMKILWNINKFCVQINGKHLNGQNHKTYLKKNIIPSFNIIRSTLLSKATMQYLHQCINFFKNQSFGFTISLTWYYKPIGLFFAYAIPPF